MNEATDHSEGDKTADTPHDERGSELGEAPCSATEIVMRSKVSACLNWDNRGDYRKEIVPADIAMKLAIENDKMCDMARLILEVSDRNSYEAYRGAVRELATIILTPNDQTQP